MVDIAQRLDTEGVAAAAVFGDAVGHILAPIKNAIETFAAIDKYKGVLPAAVELIGNDIAGVVGFLGVIAQQADAAGVVAADVFSTAVGHIFAALKTAIDTLTGLQDYKGVGPEHVQRLLDDIIQVADMTGTMAYRAGAAESSALEWQNHLESYATRMKAGLDAIRGLNGLQAHATISASTSIVEDSGGGGGNPNGNGSGLPGFGNGAPFAPGNNGNSNHSSSNTSNTTNYNSPVIQVDGGGGRPEVSDGILDALRQSGVATYG
jgi:hypothetical protein